LFDVWKKDLPSIFVYEFVTDEKTLTTRAEPICVKPKSKYAGYSQFVVPKRKGIGSRKENLNLLFPRVITVGGRFTVDNEYRLEPELQFVEETRSEYRIDLVKEGGQWAGTTNSTYSDWRTQMDFTKIKLPIILPECTDEQIGSDEVSKIKLASGDVLTEQEYKKRQESREKKTCER
jgi:hypothetical protein